MGEEVKLLSGESIVIEATATVNPDIGHIDKIELVEQGTVIYAVESVVLTPIQTRGYLPLPFLSLRCPAAPLFL